MQDDNTIMYDLSSKVKLSDEQRYTGWRFRSCTLVGLSSIFEVPLAGGQLLQLSTALAGWWNIPNLG